MHPKFTPEFVARFWAKVDKTGSPHGCWLWTGSAVAGGYGQICFRYQMHYTHRVAYELAFGPIPEGMDICHSCDHLYERGDRTYKRCIRNDGEAHLWLGTRADNMADAGEKGLLSGWSRGTGDRNGARTHPESRPRGDAHFARLHPELLPRGDSHPLHLHPELIRRGSRSGHHTLVEEEVSELRALYASGAFTQKELAMRFGIDQTTVSKIILRQYWKHVT
jgi:hypothetical protein